VDVLKISGGDNWASGCAKRNSLMNELLNKMGLNASTIGNHDLDGGTAALSEKIKNSTADWVLTNTSICHTNPLSNVVKKSAVQEINGTKYGFVGAMPKDTEKKICHPENMAGMFIKCIDDTIVALQKEVNNLKEQGINRIILKSHKGLEADQKIAQNVSGIDVIVSGHSHDVTEGIKKGENFFMSPAQEPVVIVQSGRDGKNYSILDLEFDSKGKIVSATNNMKTTTPGRCDVVKQMDLAVMGISPTVGNIAEIDPAPANMRTAQHGWQNFLADALRSEMDTDLSFINSGIIRTIPPVGKLTERDISESVPFKCKVVTTTMNEAEVVSAIEFGAKSMASSTGSPGLIQVGGMRYKLDTQGNLLSAETVDKQGNSAPINVKNPSADKVFTVAIDNFLASGREFPDFKTGDKPIEMFDFDKDETAFRYLAKMPEAQRSNLKFVDDGRIEIVTSL
jgi:2',3'-cyclic-nucleotide 2'-phosphodiesterase (5'-nucleotidase family)